MAITHSFVSGEANPGGGLIGGEDWDADHVGSPDWDFRATLASDQSVTNSATLVSANDIGLSVTAGDTWHIEYDIIYSSDATGDFKFQLTAASGTIFGWWRYLGSDTTANAVLLSTGLRLNAVANTTTIAAGGGTTTVRRSVFIESLVEFSATTTLNFQFAQNTQTSGQSAVLRQGSQIRARRLM